MDEKLSQDGLVNYLVDKHSMAQEDAQQFVKTFFELIEEELLNEGGVKVKGLGVFKRIAMESRDCISVNNGERIQIDGYNKIVFTPEASVRELINKPFAHFESVILKDSTVFEDMTETEVEEQTSEFYDEENEADSDNEYKAENEMEETTSELEIDHETQSEPEEQTILKPEQPEQAEQVECEVQTGYKGQPEYAKRPEHELDKNLKPEKLPSEQQPTLPIEEINTTGEISEKSSNNLTMKCSNSEKSERNQGVPDMFDKKQPQTGNWALSILIFVIIFLLSCGAVLIYLYSDAFFPTEDEQNAPTELKVTEPDSQVEENKNLPQPALITPDSIRSISTSNNATEKIKDTNTDQKTAVTPQSSIQQTKQAETIRKPISSDTETDTATYTITGLKTTHKLVSGNSLMRLALKYYGTKALWTYIVQYNKDIIKDPDNIPIGTVLKIPELKKE